MQIGKKMYFTNFISLVYGEFTATLCGDYFVHKVVILTTVCLQWDAAT